MVLIFFLFQSRAVFHKIYMLVPKLLNLHLAFLRYRLFHHPEYSIFFLFHFLFHLFFVEAELFAHCSLLVGRYFLLVARCSVARYFLLVAFCSLSVTFCSFARCLLRNKLTVNSKKMVWLLQNSATDIFLARFLDFR